MTTMWPDPDDRDLARQIIGDFLADWTPDELRDLQDALADDEEEEYPR